MRPPSPLRRPACTAPRSRSVPPRTLTSPSPNAQIEFGQIYLSKPVFVEADGETAVLFPKEARLRNLTYAAPL